MRLFDLFLRRAGVPAGQSVRPPRGLSRLTVVCARPRLGSLRQQICRDFASVGLEVAAVQVDHASRHDLASACVTVRCPPEQRSVLMDRARALYSHPDVVSLRWGDHRGVAIN